MKKISQLLMLCLVIFILPYAYAANANPSPIGYWRTIDDVTGKPKAIVHIYQSGRALYGKIVKIFPRPGYDQNEVCTACTGSRHNQRIQGMVIMEGLTQNADNPAEWSGGHILDPLNGKTYQCTITLIDNGEKLDARGYLGVSLFGRTQTWIRASN
jgi:uncharacterized protein (DUF2147 family)